MPIKNKKNYSKKKKKGKRKLYKGGGNEESLETQLSKKQEIETNEEEKLPEGWELKRTPSGKEYYTDHNTKTTQWEKPSNDTLKASAPIIPPNLKPYREMPDDIKKVRLKPNLGSLIDPKCIDNYETSVKMIIGHGSLLPEQFFLIPDDVRIITLSPTNVCIRGPPDINHVEPLLKYYIDGYTLFQNDDSIYELEPKADDVIDYYRKIGGYEWGRVNLFNFQYGLHLPGEIFNETNVQLSGRGCDGDEEGGINCSVICFQKGSRDYKKIYHYKPNTDELPGIDGTYISESIRLSEMIERMGKGTYILFTCRFFEGNEEQYSLSKTFSSKKRGPGYVIPPKQPQGTSKNIPGKKLFDLESVQPPEVDNSRLKRLIIKENKPNVINFEQSLIDWLVLELWLNSNEYNFDGGKEKYFKDNFNLLKSIFDRMDQNNDNIIQLDDIIQIEIIEKEKDEKRIKYFNSISLKTVILFKLPAVLLRLSGNTGSLKIERSQFYEMITKAVKYSMDEKRLLHKSEE